MYFGPEVFSSMKAATLPKDNGMQNPMYAAPGGVKSDSISKVSLQFVDGSADSADPPYAQLLPNGRPASKSYENVPGKKDKTVLGDVELGGVGEEHPYEELGPQLMNAVADEYQKLSETRTATAGAAVPCASGPYATLYCVPISSRTTPNSHPVPPSPHPHYMPLIGCPRPENPYVFGPGPTTSVTDPSSSSSSSLASPEKTDLVKIKAANGLPDDMKPTNDKSS